MFCPKCGTSLSENASFCHACGAPVRVKNDASSDGRAPAQLTPGASNAPAQPASGRAAQPAPGVASAPAQPVPGASGAPAQPASGRAAYAQPARKRSKLPAIIVAAVAVVAIAVVGAGFALGWFGAPGPGGGAKGAAYVMTQRTTYDDEGQIQASITRELDEQGNVVSAEISNPGGVKQTYEYELDENGYPEKGKYVIFNGDEEANHATESYDSEFDDAGRIVKTKARSGSTRSETEYEYYDNGVTKSITITADANNYKNVRTWDENGYQTSSRVAFDAGSDPVTASTKFKWKLDDDGVPTSVAVSQSGSNTDRSVVTFNVETDDDGNVVKLEADGEEGGSIAFEYEKVEHPSAAAYVSSLMKVQF